MKNNDTNEIRQGRAGKLYRAMPTDILVIPEVVEQNQEKLAARPLRKRRRNYVKKIMNDSFLMNL